MFFPTRIKSDLIFRVLIDPAVSQNYPKSGFKVSIFENILSRKRDEETKNSEETGISFRQSMVQIVYDMNCVSVSGLRAVHGFSIFKTAKA